MGWALQTCIARSCTTWSLGCFSSNPVHFLLRNLEFQSPPLFSSIPLHGLLIQQECIISLNLSELSLPNHQLTDN